MDIPAQQISLAKRRVLAWLLDGAIVAAMGILLSAWGWALGVLYWLGRDGLMQGRSLGKRCVGVSVKSFDTGQPCNIWTSALRNMMWIIPVVNIIMGLVGMHCLMHQSQSRHWADQLAGTRVALGG